MVFHLSILVVSGPSVGAVCFVVLVNVLPVTWQLARPRFPVADFKVSLSHHYPRIPIMHILSIALSGTLLHLALEIGQLGHINVIKMLLGSPQASDILACIDLGGYSPLHTATWAGFQNATRLLARSRPTLMLERNESDETPMHIACKRGHVMAVLELLLAGKLHEVEHDMTALASLKMSHMRLASHLALSTAGG